jgi:hypothetical protein
VPFAIMAWAAMLNFDPVFRAQHVTAPTLVIPSDGSAFPSQARRLYGLLAGTRNCDPGETTSISAIRWSRYKTRRTTPLRISDESLSEVFARSGGTAGMNAARPIECADRETPRSARVLFHRVG